MARIQFVTFSLLTNQTARIIVSSAAYNELERVQRFGILPGEKYFYVDIGDDKKKVIMRYEVNAGGTLSTGRLLFDVKRAPGEDALDAMKTDEQGRLYVSRPGGLWIISPEGKNLGTITGPRTPP
jgi:gluconolactonase